MILARSVDVEGNWEVPLAVAVFTLAMPTPTPTITPSPTPTAIPTPAVAFTSDVNKVIPPCCANLSWNVANATEVYLDDTKVANKGSQKVCPRESQSYVLRVVSSAYGEITKKITIETLPMSIKFNADQTTIVCGNSATLTWNVANAKEVYLDGKRVDASGSLKVSPKTNQTFTLRVVPYCGEEQAKQITITVEPVAVTFTADVTQIYTTCQYSTLTWSVNNVQAVYLNGQGVAGSGSMQVRQPGTYNLRVVSACGEVTKTITIVALPEPQISFYADRTTLKPGETTTLHWDVDNVQAVYLDDQPVTGHGTQIIKAYNHTYILRVATACGEYRQSVTITVSGPTVIFDLIAAAPQASWETMGYLDGTFQYGVIPFNGDFNSSLGYAGMSYNTALEDGSIPGSVLVTRPLSSSDGTIQGYYRLAVPFPTLQAGDYLHIRVGFLQKMVGASVNCILFVSQGEFDSASFNINKAYNGNLLDQSFSLAAFAGLNPSYRVSCNTNYDPVNDNLAWVIAQVERP
ncbi:MAG: hypothetical protein ACYC6L_05545 [Anaerolineae bacterium]